MWHVRQCVIAHGLVSVILYVCALWQGPHADLYWGLQMREMLHTTESDNTVLYHSALRCLHQEWEIRAETNKERMRQRGIRQGVTILYQDSRNAFPKTEAPYQGILLSLMPTSYFFLLFQQNKKVYWNTLGHGSFYKYLFTEKAYLMSMFKFRLL